MWTTIAYKETIENGQPVRLYEDSTEKSFDLYDDAIEYSLYLIQKLGISVDTYEKTSIPPGGLDIDKLKKKDALAKLTEEEKILLNIKP